MVSPCARNAVANPGVGLCEHCHVLLCMEHLAEAHHYRLAA